MGGADYECKITALTISRRQFHGNGCDATEPPTRLQFDERYSGSEEWGRVPAQVVEYGEDRGDRHRFTTNCQSREILEPEYQPLGDGPRIRNTALHQESGKAVLNLIRRERQI
jgi:hypothetical protein